MLKIIEDKVQETLNEDKQLHNRIKQTIKELSVNLKHKIIMIQNGIKNNPGIFTLNDSPNKNTNGIVNEMVCIIINPSQKSR